MAAVAASSPAPAMRRVSRHDWLSAGEGLVAAGPIARSPAVPLVCRGLRAGCRPVPVLALSVAIAASPGGGSGRGRPGGGHLVPDPAGGVEPVALGLARSGVRGVAVEGVPVVGGLNRAVGAGDGAQLTGDAGPGGDLAVHRRPELGAGAVALRSGHGVRGE